MAMETESQCMLSVISKQHLEVLVQFSSDICLVGSDETEIYELLAKTFGRRRVHRVETVEKLKSLKSTRSKIGVCEELSDTLRACTSMCFSIAAIRKIIGPGSESFTVNGKGTYKSFALNCCKVFLYEDARNEENVSRVTENNGLETMTPDDAEIVVYGKSPKSEEALKKWLLIRRSMNLETILLHTDEFEEALAHYEANIESVKARGDKGIFRNFIFFRNNLPETIANSIQLAGGHLSGSTTDDFLVVGGDIDEELSLLLNLNQKRWAFVEPSAVKEAIVNGDLKIISSCLQPLPPPPKFHSIERWEHLHIYPDEKLSDAEMLEFRKLSEELGFKVAETEKRCHVIISPVILSSGDTGCDNPQRRNIICLRELKSTGPHDSCPSTHFNFNPKGNFSVLKVFNIVGIKADDDTVFFIERVLEGSGIKVVQKASKEKKNVIFLDEGFSKKNMQSLLRLKKSGFSFLKPELIFQLLSLPDEVSVEDFKLELSGLTNSASTTKKELSTRATSGHSSQINPSVSVIPGTPENLPLDTISEKKSPPTENSAKRIKLDWNDADQMSFLSKTRDLFGLYVTHQLRFSNLQLDVGTMYTKELRNFPLSDMPITMSITFRADNLKPNTGVINDFSKSMTKCSQSPIVGGVFYDFTEDLVHAWGARLFGKLATVFRTIGFKNVFCTENPENEKGMDLFIVLGEEHVNLCCFRTSDNHFDPEVSSIRFCASKFWIPSRVVDIVCRQSRLHYALTSPHLIIYCEDEQTNCFCKKPPIEMCGKLVHHTFHNPEHASKLARKGVWAYFKRTGEFSGDLLFDRAGAEFPVQARSYEDLTTKLLELLRKRPQESIVGNGKVACSECCERVGSLRVSKIESVTMICYKCGKSVTQGVLVL